LSFAVGSMGMPYGTVATEPTFMMTFGLKRISAYGGVVKRLWLGHM